MIRINFSSALLILSISLIAGCSYESITQTHDAYVIGTISNIEAVVIQNKAKGMPSRTETRITIEPTEAFDAEGNKIPGGQYDDPVFAGDADLVNQYKTGEKVKIVCSSLTGRHIKTIERVN